MKLKWFDVDFYSSVDGVAFNLTIHSVGAPTAERALALAKRIAATTGIRIGNSAIVYPLTGRDMRTAMQRMATTTIMNATGDTLDVRIDDDTLTLHTPTKN